MTQRQTPRQTVRMSRHLWTLLGREARKNGATRSEVIRSLVTEYLRTCGVAHTELIRTAARDDR